MQIASYSVAPALPEPLTRLQELAHNLWWCWNHQAIDLFRRLDYALWEEVDHNPVRLLGVIDQERLEEAAGDEGFLNQMRRVLEDFDVYLERGVSPEFRETPTIAYFAVEFGLTECMPLYSGGLAVLAGDHLKSASDLGLPLIGVGLLYGEGYFQQYLNEEGWQQEVYAENDFHTMPLRLETHRDGTPLLIEVAFPESRVQVQVWGAQVGRVPLFLLDTHIAVNRPEDREITAHLYGGDMEMRIRQEILLGIGGVRTLEALGRRPGVCHMNEGHSAFLGLERIRLLIQEEGLSFAEAREVAAASIFTTHTPVPAGIDVFPVELVERYFAAYARDLGLSWSEFAALGQNSSGGGEDFSMAVLALRLSRFHNGVSQLHGQVARRMWQNIWPGVPEDEVPIAAITNGVHFCSWISHDMADLFDRYLGPRWREKPSNQSIWKEVADIPDEELWRTHERRRERTITFVRRRLRQQLLRRGAPSRDISLATEVLNPEALTIGFGRRFAAYKRATLLLRDPERLERLLCNEERPVQFIIAGKAHPRDNEGKELIRQIIQLARQERFRRRLVFVENYDLVVARYLVQGVDVWLNTPRRPNEASGTSGMKATANGALNVSTLDGWWDEGYHIDIGWSIGRGEEYDDPAYQDEVESRALYEVLEKEVVPLFYSRASDGLPRAWIARMKAAMIQLCPFVNAHRMVQEYAERFYRVAGDQWQRFIRDGGMTIRAIAVRKQHLYQHWDEIRVEKIDAQILAKLQVGDRFEVVAEVVLGEIDPQEVIVELYHGRIVRHGQIVEGKPVPMEWVETTGTGKHLFRGWVLCRTSGVHGHALRIRYCCEESAAEFEPGLFFWA